MKKLIRRLKIEYVIFWLLAIILFSVYESGLLAEGALLTDPLSCYIAQTVGVLLALCLIPASLKMFSMALFKRIVKLPVEEALVSYCRWCEIRLALLTIVVLINLSVYYLTLSSIGGLCALLGLLASLFCLPSSTRIKGDLRYEEH